MNYYKEIKKLQERVADLENRTINIGGGDLLFCKAKHEKKYHSEPIFTEREKITLKEFFASDKELAIHCDTKEKAKKLLKEFDKMGQKWVCGEKYTEANCWEVHRKNTCYSNENGYGNEEFYRSANYKIYEFEDVIFEEEKFTEDEKVILRNLPEKHNWITRDTNGELWVFEEKPFKEWGCWNSLSCKQWLNPFDHLFKSIQWEDAEPCEFRKYI